VKEPPLLQWELERISIHYEKAWNIYFIDSDTKNISLDKPMITIATHSVSVLTKRKHRYHKPYS